MTNNIKELRLSFLLTPKQLADRLGIKVELLRKLENSDDPLSTEWLEAFALAFGITADKIVNPIRDMKSIIASSTQNSFSAPSLCRIGARFAIQAMVAKLGGLNIALDLKEEELANAVQNLLAYAEDQKDEPISQEQRLNRLSRSLQIVVLTILQSREVEPDLSFPQTMAIAQDGALSLLRAYSQIDLPHPDQENE